MDARNLAKRAWTLSRMTFRRAATPAEKLEAEVRHLHEIEERGEAAETPFLATGGLIVFVLLPVFLVMLGLALVAYYVIA